MKEMIQIEKYIQKVHTKFMNKTHKNSKKHNLIADLQFVSNLLLLAIWHLKRWSYLTNKPKTAWIGILNKKFKDEKRRGMPK